MLTEEKDDAVQEVSRLLREIFHAAEYHTNKSEIFGLLSTLFDRLAQVTDVAEEIAGQVGGDTDDD